MRIIVNILLIVLLASPVLAEDIYINQAGTVGDTGADCANAHSMVWINTAGNWGAGAGKISAGDTVHLCGTLTSSLVVAGSGSEGSPVTIIYEAGAKSSTTAWGTGLSAAIYCSAKNYITVNGNNVGIIENTDNGTALGTSQASHGVSIANCSNFTVENLTIRNIYVRTADGDDSNTHGHGIYQLSGDNFTISGCTISHAKYGIMSGPNGGESQSSTIISGNTITNVSTGIVHALGGSGASSDNAQILSNSINLGNTWDGCWGACATGSDWHHNDGIHIWGVSNTTDQITNLRIAKNTIGGDFGAHTTGWIFLEYDIIAPQIDNNVLYGTAEAPSNGFISVKGRNAVTASNSKIYYNTIVGNSSGNAIYLATTTGHDIRNNISYNCNDGVYEADANVTKTTCNYNNYYGLQAGNNMLLAGAAITFAQWQTAGWDANSITTDPTFVNAGAYNYRLQSSSGAKRAGTKIAGIATDILGNTRNDSNPSIGAYESQDSVGAILQGVKSQGVKWQ